MTNPVRDAIPAQRCKCGHFAKPDEVTKCRYCECREHRPDRDIYGGHNPDEPPGAEAALEFFKAEMGRAQKDLERASNEEVDAELARDMARARLMLSDDCPVTGTFDGVRVTVGQRDAWVLLHSEDAEREYRVKKMAREAAAKRLDVLGRQAITQASIAKSVGQGYGMTR